MKAKLSVIAFAVAASVSGATFANEIALFDGANSPANLEYTATSTVATVAMQGILPNPDWQALVQSGPETAVYLGGELKANVVAPVAIDVTFSFVNFKEVLWTDTFRVGDHVISNQVEGDQSFTVRYEAGQAIDFSFTSQMEGEGQARVVNSTDGSNQYHAAISDPSELNFAALRVRSGLWLLGLEDGLVDESNGPDYDDLIIKAEARVVEVPEPGSVALLGLGVVGVALTRLQRKQSA